MTTTSPSAVTTEMSHREILVVIGGLMTAMFLAALDQTIVATALPTIAGEFDALSRLSWVVTAYLLTSTVAVPLYGKVSDLYGRKPLFLGAIVIFTVGSLTAGIAQTMTHLIASRAVQGVGAGGLMAMAQTIMGDVVSPRERGRYMGYIGAVFGVSSIIGPLLGGFFVDTLSWRWVFHLNLPLGLLALYVVQRSLQLPRTRRERAIDYLGAALLTAGVTALLLLLVWGGQVYAWRSEPIAVLAAIFVVALVAFVAVERRAAEPVLPLDLFGNGVFRVSAAMSLIVGTAMFGAIVFMPLYLQVVTGVSATSSGLLLIPLVGGLLAASITAGRLTTRWGRYRAFPIAGTAVLSLGLWLLSTMSVDTRQAVVSAYMVVVGLGIGAVMQTLVLATQNAVPLQQLGIATSAMQFFRSIGGSIGVALFGALLNARLTSLLGASGIRLPGGASAESLSSPDAIAALPPAARVVLQGALAEAITFVFGLAVPVAVVGFGLSWLLHELPLRTHSSLAESIAESGPGFVERPSAAEAMAQEGSA
ncbi:MAG TPA: MDR family MFS transporter [Nitriliruptorales bacterium]|nr:MDR family MFS transporter [Nitriliruptorales bacterium]